MDTLFILSRIQIEVKIQRQVIGRILVFLWLVFRSQTMATRTIRDERVNLLTRRLGYRNNFRKTVSDIFFRDSFLSVVLITSEHLHHRVLHALLNLRTSEPVREFNREIKKLRKWRNISLSKMNLENRFSLLLNREGEEPCGIESAGTSKLWRKLRDIIRSHDNIDASVVFVHELQKCLHNTSSNSAVTRVAALRRSQIVFNLKLFILSSGDYSH
nr:MAG TPA: hypothetical protein [Caudoviricetes sp.]